MSILIVDDNEIIRILIEKMLRANHYSTLTAANGQEALTTLESPSDIRLVIADIMMPGITGLEMLKRMKASPLLKDIPVILCSVLADIENVRQGALLGCHSYLVKPIQRDLLLQKVAQALAATRPVVASLRSIQTKFGLEPKTCVDVVQAFLRVMKEDLKALESNAKQPADALPQLHLKQLAEAASILGAEQLESRISDVLVAQETKADANIHLMKLTRDMQILISVIEPQITALLAETPK
jgi:CheY-like chemotaxis protein